MALQTRDAVMMIVAFFLGLLIVSALLAPPHSPPQSKESGSKGEKAVSEAQKKELQKVVVTTVIPLSGGRFLALTRDGTLLLCAEKDGSLRLLGEFDLIRSEGEVSFVSRKKEKESKEPKGKDSIREHNDEVEEGGRE